MSDKMREAAEQAYTMTAHDYCANPVGSRDWTLFWRGWQAALAEQPAQGEAVCRTDGRCQYAIDHGAEGLGHCPKGKCAMPVVPEDVAHIAGALAMREKIAQCFASDPAKGLLDLAARACKYIGPPSVDEAKQWDGDARAFLAGDAA